MYYLSDKQLEAKEKLEDSLRKTHRNWFKDKDEFDLYMKSLIKQIKRKVNLNNAVKEWKISYKEINEKRKEKITKYYNEESKLRAYALRYYQRYFPSNSKLLEKLIEKSNNEELSNNVLFFLLENNLILHDSILIKNYTNSLVSQWRNFNKIKTFLFNKKFKKEDIEYIIEELKEQWKSLLDYEVTYRKIKRLYQAWKSEYEIQQKIVETNEDRELFNEILEEIKNEDFDEDQWLNIQEVRDYKLKQLIDKLKNKWNDKQKIIQKMLQKWYKYDIIKEFI